ncbi:MAG: SRPBCC domain-containing protein [Acidobacteriota bacterium]
MSICKNPSRRHAPPGILTTGLLGLVTCAAAFAPAVLAEETTSAAETVITERCAEAREVMLEHRLPASPEVVYEAILSVETASEWIGSPLFELVDTEVNARPGGSFRYLFRGPDGVEFAMHGMFHELEAGSRIVHSESYDGIDWEPLRVTTVLRAIDGGTLLRASVVHPSEEICQINAPNLAQSTPATFARLADYLARR